MCEANEDCKGLTEVDLFYELRQGPGIILEPETNSWVMSCDDANAEFIFADPAELEAGCPAGGLGLGSSVPPVPEDKTLATNDPSTYVVG